jgi:hypothetical protein
MGRLMRRPSINDHSRHFDELLALAAGTSVTLERGGRRFRGVFVGGVQEHNETWVRVRVQDEEAGGETHFVSKAEAFRVTVDGTEGEVELPHHPHGATPTARPRFVKGVVGPQLFRALTDETELDVLFIGKGGVLQDELREVKIGVRSGDGRIEEGRLFDLARTRQLVGANRAYRSFIAPSSVATLRPAVAASRPAAVVFDTPLAFLKWRHYWPASNLILLLDRTDSRCSDGADAINEDYAGRSLPIPVRLSQNATPPSVELMAYFEPLPK